MGRETDCQNTNHIISIIRSAASERAGSCCGPQEWRPARCDAIRRHCTTALGDEWAWVAYTLRYFGKTRLVDLTDHQLERTYRHVITR